MAQHIVSSYDTDLENLRRSILAANDVITERVESHPELAGMGTTVTALLRAGERFAHLIRQVVPSGVDVGAQLGKRSLTHTRNHSGAHVSRELTGDALDSERSVWNTVRYDL